MCLSNIPTHIGAGPDHEPLSKQTSVLLPNKLRLPSHVYTASEPSLVAVNATCPLLGGGRCPYFITEERDGEVRGKELGKG